MSDHYLTVHFETGDQEYLTLQCGLTGPDRPCAVITCPVDHEDASRSCIAEHGATPLDECWAESWFEHGGREAINTEALEPVTIPVTVEYDTGVLVHDILPCPPAPEVERWQEALDRARDACACCGDPIDRTGIPDHHHVTYCTDCLAASCSEYPGECGKVPQVERLQEALTIATRCLADIVANGHRRTGPACAGFAQTALERIGGLEKDFDDMSFDTREPPRAER